MKNHDALMMVDLQNDFCPLGSLAVPQGNDIIPLANRLAVKFKHVIASQDWHPKDHTSFAANHKGHQVGEMIDLNGLEQILWPVHCVQNTKGADFHPDLNRELITYIVQKGTNKDIDSYSAFFDNAHLNDTGLNLYLEEKGINHLYILGLATDYCVKYTALDGRKLGFAVTVITDACRGIEKEVGDIKKAYKELQANGVTLIESSALL